MSAFKFLGLNASHLLGGLLPRHRLAFTHNLRKEYLALHPLTGHLGRRRLVEGVLLSGGLGELNLHVLIEKRDF